MLVVGTRLNWQWHFGEPPRWARHARFIIVDIAPTPPPLPSPPSPPSLARLTLLGASKAKSKAPTHLLIAGDAKTVVGQLNATLHAKPGGVRAAAGWVKALQTACEAKRIALAARLSRATHTPPPPPSPPPSPSPSPLQRTPLMDYDAAFGAVVRAIGAAEIAPYIVNEGANTMDYGRLALPMTFPRQRLDAGTWGTMGVGLGYAVAAAMADSSRPVLAILGDSAFGFSAMECEVVVRYRLPVVIVVFNNGGVYGGDRRTQEEQERAREGLRAGGFPPDPAPTAFAARCRYERIMAAFGGVGVAVDAPAALEAAVGKALRACRAQPTLINATIDPEAGAESASLLSHNFAAKL